MYFLNGLFVLLGISFFNYMEVDHCDFCRWNKSSWLMLHKLQISERT